MAHGGGSLFERMVALGDSVSQGTQNVGVSVRTQRFGLPALLTHQAGHDLPLPLLREPGYPPHIDQLGMVVRSRLTHPHLLEGERVDPTVAPRNFAIAGARLSDVAGLTCGNMERLDRTIAVKRMMRLVLNPLERPEWEHLSQLDRAIAEDPTVVLLWAGANDVLEALFYPHLGITPFDRFERLWRRVLDRLLHETSAPIIVLTVPDVTYLPLVRVWARRRRLQTLLKRTVDGFNAIIRASDRISDRIVVGDLDDPMHYYAEHGVKTAGWDLPYAVTAGQLDFRPLRGVPGLVVSGGLASYDGLHPTCAGYGLMCNVVIDILRAKWGVDLPAVDIEVLARQDTSLQKPDPYSWLLLAWGLKAMYGHGVLDLERMTWPLELLEGRLDGAA